MAESSNVDYVYYATLDDKEVIKALDRIDARAEALGKKLNTIFETINRQGAGAFSNLSRTGNAAATTLQQRFGKLNLSAFLKQLQQIDAQLAAMSSRAVDIKVQPVAQGSTGSTATTTTSVPIVEKSPIDIKGATESTNAISMLDSAYKEALADQIRLLTANEQLNQGMVEQSITVARTADELIDLVSATGALNPEQLELAINIAQTRQELDAYSQMLANNTGDYATNVRAVKELEGSLANLQQQQQQTLQSQNVSARENALKSLIATELRAVNAGDDLTRSFISQASASTKTVDGFLDLVRQSTNISEEQIAVAQTVANTKDELLETLNTLGRTNEGYDENAARVRELLGALEELEAAQVGATLANQRTNASQKQRNDDLSNARRLIIANINANEQLRNAVAAVALAEDGFTVRLGAANEEMSESERRIMRLLNSNQQLRQVLQNVTKTVGQADIAFDNLDFPIEKTNATKRSFIQLGQAMKFFILDVMRDIAREAVRLFKTLISETSKASEAFKLATLEFQNILGDDQAGQAVFNLAREQSRRVGTDLIPTIATILPKLTDPRAQIPQIADIAAGLLTLPQAVAQGRTSQDVAIALGELLAEQPRSAQTRFNIPLSVTRKFIETQRTQGQEAALAVLQEFLVDQGVGAEVFEQALKNRIGQVKEGFREIYAEIGRPLNIGIADFLGQLNDFLLNNKEDLIEFAITLGTLAQNFVELVGAIFFDDLENADIDGLTQKLADLNEQTAVSKARFESLAETGGKWANPFSIGFNIVSKFLDIVGKQVEHIIKATASVARGAVSALEFFYKLIKNVLQFFGVDVPDAADEGFNRLREGIDNFVQFWVDGLGKVEERWIQARVIILEGVDSIRAGFAGIGAGLANLDDLLTGKIDIDEFNQRVKAAAAEAGSFFDERQRELAASLEASNDAAITANEELAAAIEERKELLGIDEPILAAPGAGTISEEALETAEDLLKRRLELEKKYIEAEIDLEIAASQKREDIWTKYYDTLKDLDQDYFDAVEDADLELTRDQEDLNNEIIKKEEEALADSADKRLEIERDYQRKLAELKRRFQFDAEEAIRQNDAIAFLRLRRQLEFDRREARIRRDEELEDVSTTEQQKLDEVKAYEEEKRAELQLSYERELEDLRIKDARKRRDAMAAREQELRDLETDTQRRLEELQRSYERELEEFNVYQTEKEVGTAEALKELYDIVKAGNEALADTESELYKTRIGNFERFIEEYKQTAAGLQVFQDSLGDGSGSGVGGATDQFTEQRLRKLRLDALRLANIKGILNDSLRKRIVEATTVAELQAILTEIAQRSSSNNGGNSYGRRASGGVLAPNSAYVVGELGPELLITNGFGGRVLPNMQGGSLNLPTGGTTNTTNNQININPSMLDPNSMSPAQMAIMQEAFISMFGRIANAL